jgi:4-carboxymuconolactone decarboxylase
VTAAAMPGPAQGSRRLPDWDITGLDSERREVAEQVTAGRGRLPTPYRVWLASPGLAKRMHPLGQFLSGMTTLSRAEAEIAILSAARQWGGQYVLAVHAREAAAAGLAADVIAALTRGGPVEPVDPRQRAVADMMAALAADQVPPSPVFDAAVGVLGHEGVAEILALAGYFTAVTLAMKMYGVAPPGDASRPLKKTTPPSLRSERRNAELAGLWSWEIPWTPSVPAWS